MIDWLRFLLMIFYAPLRGLREMRDHSSLAPVARCSALFMPPSFFYRTGVCRFRVYWIAWRTWLFLNSSEAAGVLIFIVRRSRSHLVVVYNQPL